MQPFTHFVTWPVLPVQSLTLSATWHTYLCSLLYFCDLTYLHMQPFTCSVMRPIYLCSQLQVLRLDLFYTLCLDLFICAAFYMFCDFYLITYTAFYNFCNLTYLPVQPFICSATWPTFTGSVSWPIYLCSLLHVLRLDFSVLLRFLWSVPLIHFSLHFGNHFLHSPQL